MPILLNNPYTKTKWYKIWWTKHIPHKTKSGSDWCKPILWAWVFGGLYDSGNGYGHRPPIWWHIHHYYKGQWNKAGYTIWSWISGSCKKYRNVKFLGMYGR